MRLQLHLTPNTEPVPFNHLHQLTGALHKWLGQNELHDGLSLYSFGWLKNAQVRNGYLHFPKGCIWNLSFSDDSIIKKIIAGIMDASEVAYGLLVKEVRIQEPPEFGASYGFRTDGSAIVVRRQRDDNTREYLLWDNLAADAALTGILRRKLEMAGFTGPDLNVSVSFDRRYARARTRKITIKNTEHKGSECPVIVEGTPEAVQFAWLVGIGELTGSGFGGVY